MDALGTPLPSDAAARRAHQEKALQRVDTIRRRIELGGGEKAMARHKAKGKWTARERIAALCDPDSFQELGTFAGEGMHEAEGGVPGAGTVMGVGRIAGREAMIVANDATVKAGAWFPITAKKNLRAQEICLENRLPIVYLVDSAGVFLPRQDEIFPDKEHFGRIFRNNAVLSAMGVPQIAAIMGSCVAGGAYLPIMSDEALIVRGTGSVFLAGSHLVRAAIGEVIDNESLGGADVHCGLSGVCDYAAEDDEDCLRRIREIFASMNHKAAQVFDRIEPREPAFAAEEMPDILPADLGRPWDSRELLARLVDGSEWVEYKPDYGKTLLCGTARVEGWSVGIVANQRTVVKSAGGEMQMGGVIYSDSADKATRFILNCNQRRIPLVFLQDVTGFMVGSKSEHGGIIKDGAKLVNAVANSVVPKITFIVGNSFGAGNYALCGKAYDPRFIYSLPASRIAVMGGQQAANVLLDIRVGQEKRRGHELTAEEKAALLKEIQEKYEREMDPVYAAARLWVDEIIDPREMRSRIDMALRVASHNPDIPPLRTGVLQT